MLETLYQKILAGIFHPLAKTRLAKLNSYAVNPQEPLLAPSTDHMLRYISYYDPDTEVRRAALRLLGVTI